MFMAAYLRVRHTKAAIPAAAAIRKGIHKGIRKAFRKAHDPTRLHDMA